VSDEPEREATQNLTIDLVKCACPDCVCVFNAKEGLERDSRIYCGPACANHHKNGNGCVNHGRRYRYYIERSLVTREAGNKKAAGHQPGEIGSGLQSKGWRLPAHEIEQLVLRRVADFLRDRGAVLDALRVEWKSPDFVAAALARASNLANACDAGSFANQSDMVEILLRRVTVRQDYVTIEIRRKALVEHLLDQQAALASEAKSQGHISIQLPVRFRRRGVEAKLVVLDQQRSTAPDANLIKALARAHEWFSRITHGEANGIGDIACAEGLDRAYVTPFFMCGFSRARNNEGTPRGATADRAHCQAANQICAKDPPALA
jgi:site-specific DNA recombinase